MIVQTANFGELDIQEDQLFYFNEGIPGFRQVKRYALIEVDESPFMYLQSADNGDISFIVVSPFEFFESYEFTLPADFKEHLGLDSEQQVKIVSIISIRDELASATVNLGAPVVLNTHSMKGEQFILPDGKYSIHQPLFGDILTSKGGR